VVVVAAAGNAGFRGGDFATGFGYNTVSITDPGNADAVITVGATHRSHPHKHGVSYFSSRGPTADGRVKPDLLAPGEDIDGPVPGGGLQAMHGTSQAAAHISGAAAILMARYRELRGRPERVKELLCSTATDLGREPFFQGHGLVDVLRAMQAI
jgi:subtilisin family serine protease